MYDSNHYICRCTQIHTSSITSIVSPIQSTIVSNRKVRSVSCFYWIQFPYDLTHSISLMHSHSYLITHLHYFLNIFFLFFYSIWYPQSYNGKKNIYRQLKSFLEFIIFCVAKEIFCTCYLIVSICLNILNLCTQLASYGSQEIKRRCWVWLICDLI